MIRLKGILLGKQVNLDPIDMRAKEKLILIGRDHITRINLM